MYTEPIRNQFLQLEKIAYYIFFAISIGCSSDTIPIDDNSMEILETIEDVTDSTNQNDSGASDEGNNYDTGDTGDMGNNECGPESYIFNEKDGLVVAEFEKGNFSGDWILDTSEIGYSGEGYMVWTGSQSLSNPGNGYVSYTINISNPGTYQFIWKSAVTVGDNGTDHNDTWLRFMETADFYAQNGNSIVYPKGSGKTPNPEGAGAEGWFKIYRSGQDLSFKWQASTFDNNPHEIYVTFESTGEYTMEVSARSSGHAIDKFILFEIATSKSEALAEENNLSEINCN